MLLIDMDMEQAPRIRLTALPHTRDVWQYSLIASPHVVNAEKREECSKAFVEPDIVPPLHGDEVPEPLVSDLVTDDVAGLHQLVRALYRGVHKKTRGVHR